MQKRVVIALSSFALVLGSAALAGIKPASLGFTAPVVNNVVANVPSPRIGDIALDTNGTPTFKGNVDGTSSGWVKLSDEGGTLPAGLIFPYVGNGSPPPGFLLCDGTPVAKADYPDLWAAIGHNFGDGTKNADGTSSGFSSSTHFNLPDLRGRFLRGKAFGLTSRDPDLGNRQAMNDGGQTNDNVGSVQVAATKRPTIPFTTGGESNDHYHGIPSASGSGGAGYAQAANSTFFSNGNNWNLAYSRTGGVSQSHTHSVTNGGDNDTRPVNAYVNYIIKI